MSWRRRWRAWLRAKLAELGKRARAARQGWRDPQPVLAPPWRPSLSHGALWNYDLGFTRNESILGLFVTVRNELFNEPGAAAMIANAAKDMAHHAAREEVARRAAR